MIVAMRDAQDTNFPCDVRVVYADVGAGKTFISIVSILAGGVAWPASVENPSVARAIPFPRLGTPPLHLSRTGALRRVHGALLHRPSVPYGLRAGRWAMPSGIASVTRR
jgi:bifunctional ADP-heptose synthase (sugar kinase/adenylyltransferase)